MKSLPLIAIILLVNVSAQCGELDEAETAALLAKIAASRSGKAMTATFDETKTLPMMREPIRERGTISFEPPAKFLRRTDDGNLAVSDGKTLWMYYPAFQQAEKYPLDARGPGALFSMLTKVFQLDDLPKHFRVAALKTEDGFRLVLVPKAGAMRRMIGEIALDLDEGMRLRASRIVGNEGDRMDATYSAEKSVPLGATDFEFAPPQGTNVVSPMGD